MLQSIGEYDALAGWQADAPDDLGVMLVESWAYVLDVLSFYDARIAERSYLTTAHDEITTTQIADLIGFVPRPALSASVELALQARGADPVTVPRYTAFRSEAFGDEAPQVFETDIATIAWPQRNKWKLARIRDAELVDDVLRFRSAEGPPRGSVIAIRNGETPLFAGRVRRVVSRAARDGERYQRVEFVEGTELGDVATTPLKELSADVLGLEIGLSSVVPLETRIIDHGDGKSTLRLDSLYPRLGAGQFGAVQVDGKLYPVVIESAQRHDHSYEVTVGSDKVDQVVPMTEVTIAHSEAIKGDHVILHVAARPLGQPTQPAKAEIVLADIAGGTQLAGTINPLGDAPANGNVIAVGARERGARLSGTTTVELPNGDGMFTPSGDAKEFAEPLHMPVHLYGNVVTAIRGETVREEILGSGDASVAFQSFTLRKKPLSWVTAGDLPLGRAPRIKVAVNGEYWTYVETLFGHRGNDRVFTIKMDPDGTAHIGFGDGKTGARLPTGVQNVRASYSFGAGAATPPAGSIKQLVRPPRGLEAVKGPLPGAGGADAQSAAEIAALAPGSTLTLGKAVSIADFSAMARNYTGIVNAAASTRWDPVALQQVIDLAIIAEEGDRRSELEEYLEARAAPGVSVNVSLAQKVDVNPFRIELEVAPSFVGSLVKDEVSSLLFDPERGLLAPSRIPIGAPLFRSQLLAAIHSVPGVQTVTSIGFGAAEMPYAKNPGAGAWYDLLANGEVA